MLIAAVLANSTLLEYKSYPQIAVASAYSCLVLHTTRGKLLKKALRSRSCLAGLRDFEAVTIPKEYVPRRS